MATPARGGGAASKPKTDADKLKTAIAQVKTATGRLDAAKSPQSATLKSYANTGDQTYQEQKQATKANPLERIGAGILAQLNRPSQGVLRGIQAQQRGGGLGDVLRGVGRGVTGSESGFQLMPDDETNLRGALNTEQFEKLGLSREDAEHEAENQVGAAGRVPTAFLDIAGTTVLDPTTYLGLGGVRAAGGVAKSALKTIEKGAGKEISEQIAKRGANSLSSEQLDSARTVLRESDEAKNFKGGPDAYVTRLLGGDAKFIGREAGELGEAQGLKFAGKTVLRKEAIDNAARAAGLPAARDAVAASRPGQWAADAFKARAGVARALGQDAADRLGQLRAAAKGKEAVKLDDLSRELETAIKAVNKSGGNADEFMRNTLGPALETGNYRELHSALKSQGRTAEADLVRVTDNLRRRITNERLSQGLLRKNEVRDINTWIPRVVTPEFKDWLAKNSDKAEELFNFRPRAGGVLQNAEAHFRRLPYETVREANDAIAEQTGGAVTRAFEDAPVQALAQYAGKTFGESAKVDILRGLTEITDEAGNPLLIKGVDNAKAINDLKKTEKTGLKQIDDQIKSAEKRVSREKVRSAITGRNRKAAEGSVQSALRNLEQAQAKADKLESRAIAAGVDQRTARELGRTLRWDGDELVGEGVNAAPSAQQRIGRTSSASKFTGQMLTEARRKLAAAEKEYDRATERLRKITDDRALAEAEQELVDLRNGRKAFRDAMRQERTDLKAAEKIERPDGYVAIDAGPLGKFYGPKEIVDELAKLEGKFNDKTAMRQLGSLVEGANQAWKNLTLNAPPFFVARVVRDGFGNQLQMWQKGFKDPTAYKPATNIVRSISRGTKGGVSRGKAIEGANLSPQERRWLTEMDDHGVINSGQLRSDINHAGVALSKGDKNKRRINPKNAESIYTKWGSQLNTIVDDTSRMAFYIDLRRQGMSAAEAAKTVKEALFDYADLTEFEQSLRKLIPFYTFMSRNLQLQTWALLNVPQKTLAIERMRENLGGDTGDTVLPSYALRSGQIPLMSVGGTPILGSIQTPMQAAEQTVQPLVDIASYALPERYTTQAGLQGGAAGLLGNVGGIGGNAGKQLATEAGGTNLFTGAPVDKSKSAAALRLLDAFAPRGGQYRSTISDTASGSPAERTAKLLSLLGVSTTAVTDKRETGETYRRKRAVETAAERQGLPKASELKKKTGKKSGTNNSSTSEAIKKLRQK